MVGDVFLRLKKVRTGYLRGEVDCNDEAGDKVEFGRSRWEE